MKTHLRILERLYISQVCSHEGIVVIAVVTIRILICLSPPFQNSSIILSSIQGNVKFLVNRHLFGSDYHDTFGNF
jgi:hypothetical protein